MRSAALVCAALCVAAAQQINPEEVQVVSWRHSPPSRAEFRAETLVAVAVHVDVRHLAFQSYDGRQAAYTFS